MGSNAATCTEKTTPDFAAVDRRLREILQPLRSRLLATKDESGASPLERMQGKSCFNFTTVDDPLFGELARITQAAFEPYLVLATEVAKEKTPARPR